MIEIRKEFSTHSKEYGSHNIIQQLVAKALVRDINSTPKTILELGCGSGQIYKNINFPVDYYYGVDFSQQMCELHPKGDGIDISCFDFDSDEFYSEFKNHKYELILSSSALQWSKDLSKLVKFLSTISKVINVTLFTSNTFKSIFDITGQKSPILSKEEIINAFESSCQCVYEVFQYKLEFNTKKELFDYIKKSGVRGGLNPLKYKESKKLYTNYPYNYLEFEVIFIKASSRS
ncbi:methyltransferase [Arcobacter sp. FWKO B]|uniref:methyltransferase n=1 Tax=Arcobacter sp. FWKO B TaxID=2593672 RepID=UPI001D18062E|nr:methyltransferase [Arcobacter sp. FWKO B]